jgi:mRNA interferase MazF
MTNYRFGDVISVQFPQSGRPDNKRRPAVVILDIGDADVVVVPVTSVARNLAGDHALADWSSAGLIKPSWVRLAKPFFALKSEVARKYGRLSDSDRAQIAESWTSLYGTFAS